MTCYMESNFYFTFHYDNYDKSGLTEEVEEYSVYYFVIWYHRVLAVYCNTPSALYRFF